MNDEPTKAELQKLERCPKCEQRRLKTTPYDGGYMHECISCGYFQCWRKTYVDRVPTG